jgi:hypothetical protein
VILAPRPGDRVRIHYRASARELPFSELAGLVIVAGRGRGPWNALVRTPKGLVVVPRGNLVEDRGELAGDHSLVTTPVQAPAAAPPVARQLSLLEGLS